MKATLELFLCNCITYREDELQLKKKGRSKFPSILLSFNIFKALICPIEKIRTYYIWEGSITEIYFSKYLYLILSYKAVMQLKVDICMFHPSNLLYVHLAFMVAAYLILQLFCDYIWNEVLSLLTQIGTH